MADVILNLVNIPIFKKLLSMPLQDLFNGIENQTLRDIRPKIDIRSHRDFDVDLEGDILEWSDENSTINLEKSIIFQTINNEKISEFGILLAKWASQSEWKCWDARLFLYIEPLLDRPIESSDEFLMYTTWNDFADVLSRTDKKGYSESVVLDWMKRREGFGETMEPSEDPRILPTMATHKLSSESLHVFLNNLKSKDINLLIGREYLEPTLWSIGGISLVDIMEI